MTHYGYGMSYSSYQIALKINNMIDKDTENYNGANRDCGNEDISDSLPFSDEFLKRWRFKK